MTISHRQFGNVLVLDISGAIAGRASAEQFIASVRDGVRRGGRALVANLAAVPSIDLGGLGAMLEAARAARDAGGSFGLAGVTRRINDLIVITRLLTAFDTHDSVEDAVRNLTGAARPELVPDVSPATLGAVNEFLRHA